MPYSQHSHKNFNYQNIGGIMIRKLTTRETKTESRGIEKRALNIASFCLTECMPYCDGLRDLAFEMMESSTAY
jgi:hypothetical protein